MKKIIALIALISIFSLKSFVNSQDFSKSDQNKINRNVDSLLNLFQKYGSFTKDEETISNEYVNEFSKLFSSLNIIVINDLDAEGKTPKELPLSNYINNAKTWYKTGLGLGITIDNRTTPILEKDYYISIITVNKSILGYYKDNIRYEQTFKQDFYIKIDKTLNSFKIDRISPHGNVVIVPTDQSHDKKVSVDISTNASNNQNKLNEAYLNNIQFADKLFIQKDYENSKKYYEKAKALKPNEDLPKLKIKKIENILDRGPYLLIINVNPFFSNINIENYSKSNLPSGNLYETPNLKNKLGYGGNVAFERIFKKSPKLKTGIGVGFGANYLQYELSIGSFTRYLDTIDIDGDNVNLRTKAELIEESNKLLLLEIPIYFKLIKGDINSFTYFVNIGLKFSVLISQTYNSSAKTTYWGKYQQYNGIELYGNELGNNFGYGKYELDFRNKELDFKKSNISGFVEMGINLPITEKINTKIGLSYCLGFTNLSNYDGGNFYLTRNYNELNSITKLAKTFNINSLNGIIGITYRLSK